MNLGSEDHIVSEDDWIIRGLRGELYSCKPDMFEMTCSSCGFVKPNMDLGTREYVCDNCALTIDRDLNASINILNYRSPKSDDLKERGDEVRH